MNPLRVEPYPLEAAQSGIARVPTKPPQAPAQPDLFAAPAAEQSDAGVPSGIRFEMRPTDSLKSHPSILKQDLRPTNERLLALQNHGEAIFLQPLLITQEGLIVDGYARWLIAKRQRRAALFCQVCQLTEQEALQRILQTHCRPEWLNAFSRVQLALDLEPRFREKARANQSAGGKNKSSENLAEACWLDCRKQVATLAGVSTGNVTKVKQIRGSKMASEVTEALRTDEISIHRAWLLSKLSVREQEAELGDRRSKNRIKRLWVSLSKHIPKSHPEAASPRHLILGLTWLRNSPIMATHRPLIDELLSAVERQFPARRSISDDDPTKPQANTGRQSAILGSHADKTSGPRELSESA